MDNADMPAMPAGSVRKKRPAHDPGGSWVETDRVHPANPGLSKREYFAAMAMQGFLSGPHAEADCGLHGLAHDSVTAADELLKALDGG